MNSPNNGIRYNDGKAKLSLILDADAALIGATRVLMNGVEKYSRGNWKKGLSWAETLDSALRHLIEFNNGRDLDGESGLHHLDHALVNLLFLSQFQHTGTGTDDRTNVESELPPG